MAATKEVSLTEEMRTASKVEHDRSHSIVLGKMVMVLTSRALYGRALVCFYIIFEELERQLQAIAHTSDFWGNVWSTLEPVSRAKAIEEDLQFYLPDTWREVVTETKANNLHVQNYVSRLQTIGTLEPRDRHLFTAYVYHLYLGLLAGGSILKKMVRTTLRLSGDQGLAIFDLRGENEAVRDRIKQLVNAQQLDTNQRGELMKESSRVFALNNDVVANFSTEGYMSHNTKLVLLLVVFFVLLVFAVLLTRRLMFG